jgi:hypothetical protein
MSMRKQFQYLSNAGTRITAATACLFAALLALHAPSEVHSQNIIWVHDGINLPAHRLRGQSFAEEHLKAGVLKFYVSVCTFPAADKKKIRRYEIRKTLYAASGVIVMANLCNDILPNASQQEAFVAGYNARMDMKIGQELGREWKEVIEKQVEIQRRRHPKGTLQAGDIESETPY